MFVQGVCDELSKAIQLSLAHPRASRNALPILRIQEIDSVADDPGELHIQVLMNGPRRKDTRLGRLQKTSERFGGFNRTRAIGWDLLNYFSEPALAPNHIDSSGQSNLKTEKPPSRGEKKQSDQRKKSPTRCETMVVFVEKDFLSPFGCARRQPDGVIRASKRPI
jgi:hypothetical protein